MDLHIGKARVEGGGLHNYNVNKLHTRYTRNFQDMNKIISCHSFNTVTCNSEQTMHRGQTPIFRVSLGRLVCYRLYIRVHKDKTRPKNADERISPVVHS